MICRLYGTILLYCRSYQSSSTVVLDGSAVQAQFDRFTKLDMASIQDEESNQPLLTINNVPVHFSQDWNTGIGGGLWSTGWAMAKYFESHSTDIEQNLARLNKIKQLKINTNCDMNEGPKNDGISAIELGSGNGFLSVCLLAALSTNKNVLQKLVVTDMADHLTLMQSTIDSNSYVYKSGSVDVSVEEHAWGSFEDNVSNEGQQYDFIFGTDLAYRDYLYEPLISSLLRFSHDHTVSLIGVTMTDTRPKFFDMLREAGFRYERLADHLLEGEFQSCTSFGIFVLQRAM